MSFYVTSEISPIIDMDEVIYDPWKPIGTGGYGTVYRGTVMISFLMDTHIHTNGNLYFKLTYFSYFDIW
jgi:hypothetical protein